MNRDLNVVKIGGNILDDPQRLDAFLRDFATLPGLKILVHGGGKIATAIGDKLGIASRYEQGRRVTDEATLRLVTMVYGGLVSKQLVAQLQALRCNAIGLTGADANIIQAHLRPVKAVDYGFVGDVPANGVSVTALDALMNAGMVPVMAPLTHDGAGNMLNTNADTIAQEIAKALSAHRIVRLIYCFEKPGVLRDAEDDSSFIASLTKSEFHNFTHAGIINGGMIPKLENAFDAIGSGVARVVIGQAESLAELVAGTKGTQIQ